MRKLVVSVVFIHCTLFLQAQSNQLDSLYKDLLNRSEDSSKIFTLLRISNALLTSKPDTAKTYAEQALSLSKKIKNNTGEQQSMNMIANIYLQKNNYVKALEIEYEVLQMAERSNDMIGMGASYNSIGMVYQAQSDFPNAVHYFLKAKDIFEQKKNDDYLLVMLINIGDNYEKMNLIDSGLQFENQAYQLALRLKDKESQSISLTNLGNLHRKIGNSNIALEYYRSGAQASLEIDNKPTLAEATYGIATILESRGAVDSALKYAHESFTTSIEDSQLEGIIRSSILLSRLYESVHKIDSAYTYFKKAISTKDTVFNGDIIRNIQTMSINEQFRQQLIAENKRKELIQRSKNLQMLGIAIFIITLGSVLLFLSRKKYKHAALRYLGVLTLLLLFEFLSFSLYPFISELTDDKPVFVLIVTVSIAALLVPIHHKLEDWVEKKLVHHAPRKRASKPKPAVENPT